MITQSKLIEYARKAVPVFRWLIAASALFALAAIVINGSPDLGTAILIVGLLVAMAVILFILDRITKLKTSQTTLMAVIMSWVILSLILASFICLFSSAVANQPWPIKDWIAQHLKTDSKAKLSILEPAKVEPAKVEPAKVEPAKVEPANPFGELQKAVTAWIAVATKASESGSIVVGRPLPGEFSNARAKFENEWSETPASARAKLKADEVFSALSLNIRAYRTQETDSTKKPSSFKWAEELISYFENAADKKMLAEALLEKAAIYLDLSDIVHTKMAKFKDVSEEGELLIKRVSEIATGDQKIEAFRVWSRFYYNLARPKDGNLSSDWDNNLLHVAYQRSKEGDLLAPEDLKTMTQLARVIQKLGANPPQDSDKEWTAKLWEVQGRLKKVWNGSSPNVTEARSRIAPLNILGVLTMEVVLRTWIEASPTDKSEKQNALLADMDQTAIPSQRETLSLVMGTALEDGYDFDIYYDLARMQAVRLLIKSNGSLPSASDFSEIRLNLEKAREAATDTQRKAAVDSLRTFPGFELFGNASCEDFAKSLGR